MILIVDDDQSVRLSISLALSKAHLDCRAVATEREALEIVRDESTRLVVLDMNLSLTTTGRDGVEILRKIKVLRPEMPVILITAWGTIPLAVQSMNYGATDFITKPWSNQDLILKVRRALRMAQEAEAEAGKIESLETVERSAVVKAISACNGNLSLAAERLGITRQALYRRIEKYGL